jgi:AcrR family transcriptional regulator
MDRRQQRTRDAIFKAFRSLLEKKRYTHISVQDIVDEANIGRSTFYAHFETKDELLKAMCTEIFNHVFSEELNSEETHDFSKDNKSIAPRLTHILYHLKDSEKNIAAILSCESGELFMKFFKEYLSELFSQYLPETKANIPVDFVLNHLTGSFTEAVKWWIANRMKNTPEEIVRYYTEVRFPDF